MDLARLSLRKVAKWIAVVVIALIVGTAVFMFFKIRANAKTALREAKNIRVALRSADIEMYGEKKTIYNPYKPYGLEDGTVEKVNELTDVKGTYRITAYDNKLHELTGMTYTKDGYFVTFTKVNGKVKWTVDYRMNVYTFDDDDDID